MRSVVLAFVATGLVGAALAQGPRDEIFKERALARAAHEKKDYTAFRTHSARVVALAPRSLGALYNLACAEALLDRADEAAALL
ncbi:MAG TPA: hypothetical protein VIC87_06895, partial [Vicinamibacteria bacterium]